MGFFKHSFITFAALCLSVCTVAAQNAWTGAGTNNLWANSANWSANTVPDGDGAAIARKLEESPVARNTPLTGGGGADRKALLTAAAPPSPPPSPAEAAKTASS